MTSNDFKDTLQSELFTFHSVIVESGDEEKKDSLTPCAIWLKTRSNAQKRPRLLETHWILATAQGAIQFWKARSMIAGQGPPPMHSSCNQPVKFWATSSGTMKQTHGANRINLLAFEGV